MQHTSRRCLVNYTCGIILNCSVSQLDSSFFKITCCYINVSSILIRKAVTQNTATIGMTSISNGKEMHWSFLMQIHQVVRW